MECKNCCYFDVTDAPEWKGKEHCCFHEWGHGDEETAPCDYDDEYIEDNTPDDDYSDNMPCDDSGICAGTSCSGFFVCHSATNS